MIEIWNWTLYSLLFFYTFPFEVSISRTPIFFSVHLMNSKPCFQVHFYTYVLTSYTVLAIICSFYFVFPNPFLAPIFSFLYLLSHFFCPFLPSYTLFSLPSIFISLCLYSTTHWAPLFLIYKLNSFIFPFLSFLTSPSLFLSLIPLVFGSTTWLNQQSSGRSQCLCNQSEPWKQTKPRPYF